MNQLPVPQKPNIETSTYGMRSQYFAGYSTVDLVALFRQTQPVQGADSYEAVVEAHDRGEASYIDFLIALHERGTRDVFDVAVALCHDSNPDERYIGLRILRELGKDDRPIFPETWEILERMAAVESDVSILWWVLSCLIFTFKPRAVRTLLRFIDHPDPDIRELLAFGLTGCADEPNQPLIVKAMLTLANDEVDEVRHQAVYDFVEDDENTSVITADTPEIRAMLHRRIRDPETSIREMAAKALRERERRRS